MLIDVETHANAVGDREPLRFRFGTRCREVRTVLDRWLDADHGYFKVQADDGAVYILRQDVLRERWEITLYESGRSPATPPNSVNRRATGRPH